MNKLKVSRSTITRDKVYALIILAGGIGLVINALFAIMIATGPFLLTPVFVFLSLLIIAGFHFIVAKRISSRKIQNRIVINGFFIFSLLVLLTFVSTFGLIFFNLIYDQIVYYPNTPFSTYALKNETKAKLVVESYMDNYMKHFGIDNQTIQEIKIIENPNFRTCQFHGLCMNGASAFVIHDGKELFKISLDSYLLDNLPEGESVPLITTSRETPLWLSNQCFTESECVPHNKGSSGLSCRSALVKSSQEDENLQQYFSCNCAKGKEFVRESFRAENYEQCKIIINEKNADDGHMSSFKNGTRSCTITYEYRLNYCGGPDLSIVLQNSTRFLSLEITTPNEIPNLVMKGNECNYNTGKLEIGKNVILTDCELDELIGELKKSTSHDESSSPGDHIAGLFDVDANASSAAPLCLTILFEDIIVRRFYCDSFLKL